MDMYADAANLGWGGYLNQQINSRWSIGEKELNISPKDIQTLLLAGKSYAHQIKCFVITRQQ